MDNNYDCPCIPVTSIPFLDTSCSIKDGAIVNDLYRKPTDRNMYLLPSSCHPPEITTNIPYSLALRIVKICSNKETRDMRLQELKEMLICRDYRLQSIEGAINRAKNVSRDQSLKKKVVNYLPSRRPVFAVPYDPRLPRIPSIQAKHWRTMTTQTHI